MNGKIKKGIFLALCIVWIAFIFSNSMENAETSGNKSSTVVEIIEDFFEFISDSTNGVISPDFGDNTSFIVRKAAHFSEFAILSFLVFMCAKNYGARRAQLWYTVLPICLAVGAADECIQIFSAGRGPALRDVMIDFSGALTACVILYFINLKKSKKAAG